MSVTAILESVIAGVASSSDLSDSDASGGRAGLVFLLSRFTSPSVPPFCFGLSFFCVWLVDGLVLLVDGLVGCSFFFGLPFFCALLVDGFIAVVMRPN